ncbi:27166_t:CDS:2 [Gigaspora margarita]|uniref:27166_t:CDS:1 n=1 Tax=Gigaspora margarita TaxID=4874 RepID=A0ABM8VVW8_GIGMA|nr:27166_t:CDS:2 [Gigaspora margarita]
MSYFDSSQAFDDLRRIVQNGFNMSEVDLIKNDARNFLIQHSKNKCLREYYNYLNATLKNIKESVLPSRDDQTLEKYDSI